MTQAEVETKAQLLAEIERCWCDLNDLLDSLVEAELTSPEDAAGWTAKDHLVHLMAWERSALFFLQSKPCHIGLGISKANYLNTEEEINDIIFRQGHDLFLTQVLAEYHEVHQRLLAALRPLSDADLKKPYHHYLPDETGERTERPAMDVVYNNSANHYTEHLMWIKTLIGDWRERESRA